MLKCYKKITNKEKTTQKRQENEKNGCKTFRCNEN